MTAMNDITIPWSQPEIGEAELKQVVDSFRKDWLTMGPKVKEFERSMAEYLRVPHAVAVSNGTIALDIALKIMGVGPGDEVIVPAMTYMATAAAVSYQHAVPVFVDIEPQSYNLDPSKIEAALSPRTRGIIYIDYGGNPADSDAIKEIAKRHNLFVLLDAAQSLGARYRGVPAGNQTELSTMSFHMAKIMTTVEGGMIFTNNERYAAEARIRRNQGESGKYLHSHLGTNARMTDMSAGIGLSQFGKLEWMLRERKRVAQRYDSFFDGHSEIEVMKCVRPQSSHAYFFYPILVASKNNVVDALRNRGIDTRIAYPMPIYDQEVYKSGREQCRKIECPVAERFTSTVINLPIYPALTDEMVGVIAKTVLETIQHVRS